MPSKQIKEFTSGAGLAIDDMFIFQTEDGGVTKKVTLIDLLASFGCVIKGVDSEEDEFEFKIGSAKNFQISQTDNTSDLPIILEAGGGTHDGDTWKLNVENVAEDGAGILRFQSFASGEFTDSLNITSQAAAGALADVVVETSGILKSSRVEVLSTTEGQLKVSYNTDKYATLSVDAESNATLEASEDGNLYLKGSGTGWVSLSGGAGGVLVSGPALAADVTGAVTITSSSDLMQLKAYARLSLVSETTDIYMTADTDITALAELDIALTAKRDVRITAGADASLATGNIEILGGKGAELVTTAGGLLVDSEAGRVTIDGHTGVTITASDLTISGADITLDSPKGDIILDAGEGNVQQNGGPSIIFKDEGTAKLRLNMESTPTFKIEQDGGDLYFQQADGITVFGIHDAGHVSIANGEDGPGELRIYDTKPETGSSDVHYYSALTVGEQSAHLTYALPTAYGGTGNVLSATDAGIMSWVALPTSGTGTVSAGLQYKVAYYPDAGAGGVTVVDDTSALYWKNNRLGVNEADPQTDVHLKSGAGPTIRLERNEPAAIVDGDTLGVIEFYGFDDGSPDLEGVGAKIVGEASGGWVHDTNEYDTQAELQFWTTPGGDAEGLTKRLTIKDSGVIKYERATHTNIRALTIESDAANIDLDTGNLHKITLTVAETDLTFSKSKVGQRFILRVLQDGTGGRTIDWGALDIKWAGGGTEPVLTPTLNRATVLGFLTTASGVYDGFVIGKDIV